MVTTFQYVQCVICVCLLYLSWLLLRNQDAVLLSLLLSGNKRFTLSLHFLKGGLTRV